MSNNLIYRTLVPNAPLYRRTEGDEFRDAVFLLRRESNVFLLEETIIPGLQEPSLISSFHGSIDRILFCFPNQVLNNHRLVPAYQSVIQSLRVGTKFVVVHHESGRYEIEPWFTAAGHMLEDIVFVSLPDYVSLTDWAEDAYVAVKDVADGSDYLMEPWEFLRSGDALIADAVEEYVDIKASQAPLIFQGGNCLIGDDFWLLGKDYFLDTVNLFRQERPPVSVPEDQNLDNFVTELFAKYLDRNRRLYLIGTNKLIPIRDYIATKDGPDYYLDLASNGAGAFQPIFHIDMFISLVGRNNEGKFELLVGNPTLGDELLGTTSPFALSDVYDGIAQSLLDLGFSVKRNPLVHLPQIANTLTFSQLKEIASRPGYEGLVNAVKEFAAAGAVDNSIVRIRTWHHVTWNNCLVENSASVGKHVYLPTFGHGANSDLASIDLKMKSIWEGLGFTVHMLGDFNEFARRQGVVHCIKKYLLRGD
jgi:hypothetical protein